MLGALHDRPVNGGGAPLTAQAQATAATASTDLLRTVLPHLSHRLDALLRRFAATAPDRTGAVASHGDLHAGQLLVDRDGAGMIDFDNACVAPPAFDLGSYAARMVRGEQGDLDSASRTLDALADCYGRPRPGLRWLFATSILRRATSPLRYFHPDWPTRVEAMVDAAGQALDG
jgi:aminoglycoside phosphotransferase (APT) family kinase protein